MPGCLHQFSSFQVKSICTKVSFSINCFVSSFSSSLFSCSFLRHPFKGLEERHFGKGILTRLKALQAKLQKDNFQEGSEHCIVQSCIRAVTSSAQKCWSTVSHLIFGLPLNSCYCMIKTNSLTPFKHTGVCV